MLDAMFLNFKMYNLDTVFVYILSKLHTFNYAYKITRPIERVRYISPSVRLGGFCMLFASPM